MLTHLDLFSGIGGFALACEWAGIETIGFVEIDKYCQKVLRKHWPSVPIVEDIRDVEKIKEIVANAQEAKCQQPRATRTGGAGFANSSGDRRRSNLRESESPAILITAGFPCQPFSVAGKQGGEKDDRYLWPETLTVIEAIKPTWILLENVTGIINLALDTVLSDLEGAGYSYETLIIPACAVNAPHRRDRVWIVGYSICNGHKRGYKETWGEKRESEQRGVCQFKGTGDVADSKRGESWEQTEQERGQDSGRGSQEDVADTTEQRLHNKKDKRKLEGAGSNELDTFKSRGYRSDWWAVESRLGGMVNELSERLDGYFDTETDIPRVATGVKNRVDRLKCLGNAIVPTVAAQIIRVIKEVDSQWGD